jgi:hypothetical protein
MEAELILGLCLFAYLCLCGKDRIYTSFLCTAAISGCFIYSQTVIYFDPAYQVFQVLYFLVLATGAYPVFSWVAQAKSSRFRAAALLISHSPSTALLISLTLLLSLFLSNSTGAPYFSHAPSVSLSLSSPPLPLLLSLTLSLSRSLYRPS